MNQVDLNILQDILDEYIEKFVPAMLEWRYHLILVKGGPEYDHLPEQSHFAHIINGIFGLAELIKFLTSRGISVVGLDEMALRKAIALFTIHEVHKAPDLERIGSSEFSIPLERLREEYKRLGLDQFAQVDEHLMRAANVHKRSPKHGDLLLSEQDGTFLWLLVRIADTFASVKSPQEAAQSLMAYLPKLSPVFIPSRPPGKFVLYYHEIGDVRGVLTNMIHQAVADYLQANFDLFPLLYFTRGILYIGPELQSFDRQNSIKEIVDRVLTRLSNSGESVDAIKGGLRPKNFDFEKYVYSFASAEELLGLVLGETLLAKADAGFATKEIDELVSKRKELSSEWRDTVEERFGIRLYSPQEYKVFNEHWSLVRRYLLYVDALLHNLNPTQDRLGWLLQTFEVPNSAGVNLQAERGIWGRGGLGKYVLVIAYHFLRGPDFVERPAETLPSEEVLKVLHQRVTQALALVDTRSGRESAVAELGFRPDLTVYLAENLHLSFAPNIEIDADGFVSSVTARRRGHLKKLCSLCNRESQYSDELRTGILDDFGRVFSNRVLPALEAPGQNRIWCPICHLEFIFRKLTGMGLPEGSHYKNSKRIYLYVLPTFSFTPEHIRLFRPLLRPFQQVTNINVRDFGTEWGAPHYWLASRSFDPEWIEKLGQVLDRTAQKIASWGQRGYVGERISLGQITGQPHYYLITWEKTAREKVSDDQHIATRTEAWAKALFAAAIISGLTSCKVYVTERPYLPISDPVELKATITLDGPPPAFRHITRGQRDQISLYGREHGPRSGLELALDISAALWTITTMLRPNKEKNIAARLERFNKDPLAGAFFYKEFGRENDDKSPYPPFDLACEILLEIQGGELMDLVEKLAQKSLQIALPLSKPGRGKARRYELIFREGVSAMRKAQQVIPEMRQAALSGGAPSVEGVSELKHLAAGTLLKSLERRQESGRGEIMVRAWGKELPQLVEDFMEILVNEVYLERTEGNFARFIRLENSLADGIYFYTDRNLSGLWQEYKLAKANSQKAT